MACLFFARGIGAGWGFQCAEISIGEIGGRGGGRVTKSLKEFNRFIKDYNLMETPLGTEKFAWFSNRERVVFCRLDRFPLSKE